MCVCVCVCMFAKRIWYQRVHKGCYDIKREKIATELRPWKSVEIDERHNMRDRVAGFSLF